MTTMLGPVGVSKNQDAPIPPQTEIHPMTLASIAMVSGVREKRRAQAGGMMSMDVISKIPTTFMDDATIKAIRSISSKRTRVTFRPSTLASSSCKVMVNSLFQFAIKIPKTKITTMPIQIRLLGETVSRSPMR